MVNQKSIVKELTKLFKTFYKDSNIIINVHCLEFFNAYNPSKDEVVTYNYKFHIIIGDKLYVYDGWCYKEDLNQIALGIYSHWLLKTHKIYDGESTAWYNMYTCLGNIEKKEVCD